MESKTRVKSSKCSVVFAVIVGEQDTKKSGKCSVVFVVIVGEQDTRKAVNVVLCLLSLLESKIQEKR